MTYNLCTLYTWPHAPDIILLTSPEIATCSYMEQRCDSGVVAVLSSNHESRLAKRRRIGDSPELFSDSLVNDGSPRPCGSVMSDSSVVKSSESSSSNDIVFPSADSEDSASSAIFPSETENTVETDVAELFHGSVDSTSGAQDEANPIECRYPDTSYDRSEELDYVGGLLVSQCCEKHCLFHLTANDVLTLQRKFSSLGANAQRQWLGDRISENSRPSLETGMLHTRYIVGGQEVCQFAWCRVLRISPKRVSRVFKSVSVGMVTAEHGNKGKKRINTKSEIAHTWMNRYFQLVGDRMPHNNQLHLPSWETQKDVYCRFTEDMKIQGIAENDIVSLSLFYKIWGTDFRNVVIPEVRHIHILVLVYLYL